MKTMTDLSPTGVRHLFECVRPLPLSIGGEVPQTSQSTNGKRRRTGALQNFAALASAILATHAARAQTWQTVDDFQLVAGSRSWNLGLVVAPSGTIFGSGLANTASGGCVALVMASQDDGATWSAPLDLVDVANAAPSYPLAGMACDAAGDLYYALPAPAAGTCTTQCGWLVRKGTSGGSTWNTVDDFTGISGQAYGITVDASGNVFVAGTLTSGTGGATWTIRRGLGGANFSTVDSFAPAGYGNAQAVFAHPTAGVFAAGAGYLTSRRSTTVAWIVRRSLDGGATWSTVDTFQLVSGQIAHANGIGADGLGNLYVVGFATTVSKQITPAHWIVRKSSDGGNTWSTVDNFQPASNVFSAASRFVADANGNLFVAGQAPMYGAGSTGTPTWVVRESQGGTGPWSTVDTFQDMADKTQGFPEALAADAVGNVFVGGFASGPSLSQGMHWLVRKN
jgi:hypothetical protein